MGFLLQHPCASWYRLCQLSVNDALCYVHQCNLSTFSLNALECDLCVSGMSALNAACRPDLLLVSFLLHLFYSQARRLSGFSVRMPSYRQSASIYHLILPCLCHRRQTWGFISSLLASSELPWHQWGSLKIGIMIDYLYIEFKRTPSMLAISLLSQTV